jgi:Ca2+:H+ antiporter
MSSEPAPRPAAPPAGISLTGEERVMALLLILVVLSIVSSRVGWPPWLQFFLSVGAVIPLAAFIGSATEALAEKIGGRAGGLLNATFGNAPDLLVGVFGVQRGLIPLVKATLVGALISNSALIMGICYIVAGVLYRKPRFDAGEAGHHSVLMMLTAAAIIFPSVGALVLCGSVTCAGTTQNHSIMEVSVGISVVLLLAYISYVLYAIFGLESIRDRSEGSDSELMHERALGHGPTAWPLWLSIAVLAGSTVLLIPVVDVLTASVEPVTRVLGWTQVFVGMVIVANAGNVAEGYAAIRFAWTRGGDDPSRGDSGLDLALGIASASSIQIATFVAPLIVLYSLTMHNMSLVFSPVELAILGLLVIIFAYIGHDGESNWLEGAELLALYAMAAIVFFVLPGHVFG